MNAYTRIIGQLREEQQLHLHNRIRFFVLGRLESARHCLSQAAHHEAPKETLDALCRWIGELEDGAMRYGVNPYEQLAEPEKPEPARRLKGRKGKVTA